MTVKVLARNLLAALRLWHYRLVWDNYPQLVSLTSSGTTKKRELSWIDIVKTRAWTHLAKSSIYGIFYSSQRSANHHLSELIERGYTVIEDFLDLDLYDHLSDLLQVDDPGDESYCEIWKGLKESEVAKLINNTSLLGLLGTLGMPLCTPRAIYNYIRSDTPPPYVDGASDWHCDRFIPCLKGLYFPEGCDWMPFERIVMPTSEGLALPSAIIKTHYEQLPEDFSEYPIYRSYVRPNTLIICINSIFHRRSSLDEDRPGSRKILFLDWNNQYNRFSLVRAGVASILSKLSVD